MTSDLKSLMDAPASVHVLVSYNGKLANQAYVTPEVTTDAKKLTKDQEKKQFQFGCMRISDNLPADGIGYVRTPNGKYYEISRSSRMAKPITV